MRVENSPAQVPMYGNIAFDPKGSMQGTGGSTSMANSWMQLRQAGATARAMLVQAAAKAGRFPPREITVSEGVVAHGVRQEGNVRRACQRSGASCRFPRRSSSRTRAQFKLIGARQKLPRLDSQAKSTGTQQFAIDVMLPGHDDRGGHAAAAFRRQGQSIDAAPGEGGAGRSRCRADSARCRGRRARHVVGQEGPRGAESHLG